MLPRTHDLRLKTMTASAKYDNPEELVDRVYHEILEEGCVLFVGAGATTEAGSHPNFYEIIRQKVKCPADKEPLSFPDLMQHYCDKIDGGQHNRLIREIIARIEPFTVPGELHHEATRFCRAVAEIPYLKNLVTTNWDPFLERSTNVLVPMVENRDLPFWDDKKRQVVKIHGCATRPYTIVATRTDYEQCVQRNPLIVNRLKDMMATKTFLFVGYSMRDEDFQAIWTELVNSLDQFHRLAYAMDPKASPEAIAHWRGRGILVFKVYPIAFAWSLRKRLTKDGLIPSEQFLASTERERKRIRNAHLRLSQTSHGGIASAMYQDGLLHV